MPDQDVTTIKGGQALSAASVPPDDGGGAPGRPAAGGERRGPRGFPICQGCRAEATGPGARWCSGCWTPARDPSGAAAARRLGLLPALALAGDQLTLTPDCAAAGCRVPVEHPGQVCPGCQEEFGPYLRPSAEVLGAELPIADPGSGPVPVAGRTGGEHTAPGRGEDAVEWRRNQVCWVCEERRTCRRDPDLPQRWICRNCIDIT